MSDKDLLRSNRAALIAELENAGAKIRGNTVKCPFHDDKHPSGSIYTKGDVWRYKCQACQVSGDIFDIRGLTNGTTPSDELKKESRTRPKRQKRAKNSLIFASLDGARKYLNEKVGEIEQEHVYMTKDNEYFQTVFRCKTDEGKTFRPCHLTDGGYTLKAPPGPWQLYNLESITKAETVMVVEGEKCADTLIRYGFCGTTSAGGAKNAKNTDWTPLASKNVIIWRDNDSEGLRYEAEVRSILEALLPAPRISIIDPSALDLIEHEDVADFIAQLQIIEKSDAEITAAIDAVLKSAKALSIAGEVRQRIADIRTGRYAAIPWPWELLSNLTKALLPGTVTLLAGSVGASKSFMAIQAFIFWLSMGLKAALFEVEEDRTFHLTRALAQQSRSAWLTDTDAVKEQADEANTIVQEHTAFLDSFGRVIHATPEAPPSLDQLASWIKSKAEAGCRVIGIDPVTAAARLSDPWTADGRFLQAIKRTATDYSCSVLLITHPVKQCSFPDLTQLAGAACYQRFAQTILWLEHHESKTSRVKTACGTAEMEHSKTLYILKARNGRGGGYKLAFDFDAESLSLHELGLIMGKNYKK